MKMKEKAQKSICEALDQLRNKSPMSTLTERWALLTEARWLYEHLPQPVCMGRGMLYVTERASLPIAEHDLLLGRFVDKVPDEAEEERYQQMIAEQRHHGNPITMYTTGHITLDWEGILELGISGYIAAAEKRLEELRAENAPAASQHILEGLRDCYIAYRTYIVRYGEAAANAGREDLAAVCASLADHKPSTFREALQLILFVLTVYYVYASGMVTCLTLGRLDELLLPYYEKEIADGTLTHEEAGYLIDDFYAKTNLTLGRGEHQMSNTADNKNNTGWERNPMYDSPTYVLLGGKTSLRKNAEPNPLTGLFLERIVPGYKHPVIVFRWHRECTDENWQKLCGKLREGASVLVYNDETMIPAMMHAGVDPADAAEYSMHPCNWPDIHGGFHSVAHLRESIPKLLMRVLTEDGKPKKNYRSVDELFEAAEEDFRNRAREVFSHYRRRFRSVDEFPVWDAISGTDCFTCGIIEAARNWADGGVKYPAVYTVLRNIGTAADMLAALDTVVFTGGKRTLAEMCTALAENFENDRELLVMCRNAPKYGCDDELADGYAVRLMKLLLDVIDEESVNENGVRDVVSMNITTTDMGHIGEGRGLMATPDGRLAGQPLSENLSPTVGVNDGVTALLRSVSKLPFDRINAGAFNLRLSKSLVHGEDGLLRLSQILLVYLKSGGMQFQLSIADTDELRKAQKHPKEYADLLVRITGYSARFTDMTEAAQNEIIRREEMH